MYQLRIGFGLPEERGVMAKQPLESMSHEQLLLRCAQLDILELKASLAEILSMFAAHTYTVAISPEEMQKYKKAQRLLLPL